MKQKRADKSITTRSTHNNQKYIPFSCSKLPTSKFNGFLSCVIYLQTKYLILPLVGMFCNTE